MLVFYTLLNQINIWLRGCLTGKKLNLFSDQIQTNFAGEKIFFKSL